MKDWWFANIEPLLEKRADISARVDQELIKQREINKDIRLHGNFGGFGAEYEASEDYGLGDMSENQIDELYDVAPYVFDSFRAKVVLYQNGIITTPPDTEIEVRIEGSNLTNYVDISSDIDEDVVTQVLNEDYMENYEPHWYDNDTVVDYVDNLNSSHTVDIQDDIAKILDLDVEIIEEIDLHDLLAGRWDEIEQLDGLEHSDYEDKLQYILDSINRAIGSAEESEYYNHIRSTVTQALEELGNVTSNYDSSVTLTHDLDDSLGLTRIGEIIDEGYVDDIEDAFNESIDNGEIDKPNVFIDSRWTPNHRR